jgi:prolycopene isomerase
MWHVRNKTLAELLEERIHDPAARDVLAGLWGYYGLPPSKLSGFFYANATGGYLRNGSDYIRPRSQGLSEAMAAAIEAAGGEIIYGRAVTRILVKDGTAGGVALADGRKIPARSVVSNASALTTFERLVPPASVPPAFLEQLKSYRPSISTFIVWLGLNREIADALPPERGRKPNTGPPSRATSKTWPSA